MFGGPSPSYAVGANVLARSIHATMDPAVLRNTQLIALIIDGPQEPVVSHLWSVCRAPMIGKNVMPSVSFEKLWIYQLLDFERVLFIDADAFAVGDVSPLLTTPHLKAVAVTPDWFVEQPRPGDHIGFNTGVLSVKPDSDEFFRINKFRLDNPAFVNEQLLLNAYYGQAPYNEGTNEEDNTTALSWFNFSYNAWLNGIGDDTVPARGNWSQIWTAYQPAIVYHLIGHVPPTKPLDSVTDERSMVYRLWWSYNL